MEKERYLFKYRRINLTSEKPKSKKQNRSLCSRYISSANLSISIHKKKTVPFPEISKSQAKLSYNETYKNLDKVIDRNRYIKSAASPVSSYLSKIKENGLVPETMGLLSRTMTENKLDISHYSMGNSYAEALSEGIKLVKLSKAVFKNNRLNDLGASELVSKINPKYLTELNLGENNIGYKTIARICGILELNCSRLVVLNLESNNLGDRSVVLMTSVITSSDKLTELYLGNNQITEYGASALAKLVRSTHSLEKLDLHWNSIKGEGAKDLAEALCDNNSIKVLDLSWNAFNSPPGGNPIKSLSKAVRQNIKIYHLDLSNNSFTDKDCNLIGEALMFNTTLIGLHMEGNGAKIDFRGFLQLDSSSCRVRNLHLYNSPLMNKKKRPDPNCWVCQKWNEVTLSIDQPESCNRIFIHLELYNFEAEEMEKVGPKKFKISKICPPGPVRFFFSQGSKQVLSSDYPSETLDQAFCVDDFIIEECNYVFNKECTQIMWNQYFPKAYPRQKTSVSEWQVKNSIFREYVLDSPKLLDQCFEHDLSLTAISSVVIECKEHCLRILKSHYLIIKELHKYINSISRNIWKLWQENLIDILIQRNIIDNTVLKNNDVIVLMKQVKTTDSEQAELTRFQFLELVVRIALQRYARTGLIPQYEAISMIGKELEALQNLTSYEFRTKKYWNSSVDRCLKKHSSWLVSSFQAYEKEGVIGFKEFYKVVGGYFKNEEAAIKCCYLAKETRRYMKYFEMNLKFPEFLEAFCRFVDMERVDVDLKKLNLEMLVDIVITDYFKNKKEVQVIKL